MNSIKTKILNITHSSIQKINNQRFLPEPISLISQWPIAIIIIHSREHNTRNNYNCVST